MKCKNCGTKLPKNAKFCYNCGTATEADNAAQDRTDAAQSAADALQHTAATADDSAAVPEAVSPDAELHANASSAPAAEGKSSSRDVSVPDALSQEAFRITEADVAAYEAALDALSEDALSEPELVSVKTSENRPVPEDGVPGEHALADDPLLDLELEDDALSELDTLTIGPDRSFVSAYTYDAVRSGEDTAAGSPPVSVPTSTDDAVPENAQVDVSDAPAAVQSEDASFIVLNDLPGTDDAAVPEDPSHPSGRSPGSEPLLPEADSLGSMDRADGAEEPASITGTADPQPDGPKNTNDTGTETAASVQPSAADDTSSADAASLVMSASDTRTKSDAVSAADAMPAPAEEETLVYDGLKSEEHDTQDALEGALEAFAEKAPGPLGSASADASAMSSPPQDFASEYTDASISEFVDIEDLTAQTPADEDVLPPPVLDETIMYDGLGDEQPADDGPADALETQLETLAEEAPGPLGESKTFGLPDEADASGLATPAELVSARGISETDRDPAVFSSENESSAGNDSSDAAVDAALGALVTWAEEMPGPDDGSYDDLSGIGSGAAGQGAQSPADSRANAVTSDEDDDGGSAQVLEEGDMLEATPDEESAVWAEEDISDTPVGLSDALAGPAEGGPGAGDDTVRRFEERFEEQPDFHSEQPEPSAAAPAIPGADDDSAAASLPADPGQAAEEPILPENEENAGEVPASGFPGAALTEDLPELQDTDALLPASAEAAPGALGGADSASDIHMTKQASVTAQSPADDREPSTPDTASPALLAGPEEKTNAGSADSDLLQTPGGPGTEFTEVQELAQDAPDGAARSTHEAPQYAAITEAEPTAEAADILPGIAAAGTSEESMTAAEALPEDLASSSDTKVPSAEESAGGITPEEQGAAPSFTEEAPDQSTNADQPAAPDTEQTDEAPEALENDSEQAAAMAPMQAAGGAERSSAAQPADGSEAAPRSADETVADGSHSTTAALDPAVPEEDTLSAADALSVPEADAVDGTQTGMPEDSTSGTVSLEETLNVTADEGPDAAAGPAEDFAGPHNLAASSALQADLTETISVPAEEPAADETGLQTDEAGTAAFTEEDQSGEAELSAPDADVDSALQALPESDDAHLPDAGEVLPAEEDTAAMPAGGPGPLEAANELEPETDLPAAETDAVSKLQATALDESTEDAPSSETAEPEDEQSEADSEDAATSAADTTEQPGAGDLLEELLDEKAAAEETPDASAPETETADVPGTTKEPPDPEEPAAQTDASQPAEEVSADGTSIGQETADTPSGKEPEPVDAEESPQPGPEPDVRSLKSSLELTMDGQAGSPPAEAALKGDSSADEILANEAGASATASLEQTVDIAAQTEESIADRQAVASDGISSPESTVEGSDAADAEPAAENGISPHPETPPQSAGEPGTEDAGNLPAAEAAAAPPAKKWWQRERKVRPPREKRSFSEVAGQAASALRGVPSRLRNLPSKWILLICGIVLLIAAGIVFYGVAGTAKDVIDSAVSTALAGGGTGALAAVTASKTALYAGIPILIGGLIAILRGLMLFLEERSSAAGVAQGSPGADEDTEPAPPEDAADVDEDSAVAAGTVTSARQQFWSMPMILAEAACAIAAFGVPMMLHTRAASALDGYWGIDVPQNASAHERFVLMENVPRAMEMTASPDNTGITYSEFDGSINVADVRWEEPNGYSYDWFLLYPYTEGDVSVPIAALHAASMNDIGMRIITGDTQVDAQFERIAVSDWRKYVAAEAPLPDATFDLSTPAPAASPASTSGYTFTPYTFAPAGAQAGPSVTEPPERTAPPDAALPLEAGATTDATGDGALDSVSVSSDGTTVTLSINDSDIPLSFVPDPDAVYQVYVVDADPNDGAPEIIVQGLHEGYSSAHVYRYTPNGLQTVTATYSVPFAVLMEGAQPEGVSSILYDDKSYLIVPGDGSILFPVGNYGGALRMVLTDFMQLKQEPENSGVLIPGENAQDGG